jgi:N-acetylglucosamine-6-sulfatase
MKADRAVTRACLFLLGCGLLGVAASAVADGPDQRPNVILFLTDDQRWDTLQYMPAVQRLLVDRGVTFSNAFATTPLCMPSRASLLTGRYAYHTGVLTNFPPNGGPQRFVGPDASTVATWLQQAGYRTGMYGKYVNLYEDQCPPYTSTCYRPPGWDEWHVFLGEAAYDYGLTDGSDVITYGSAPEDYSTDVLAAKATEFVADAHGQPYLLIVAFHAPHDEGLLPPIPAPRHAGLFADLPPFRPPSWDEADVSDKPAWIQRRPRATDTIGTGYLKVPVEVWSDEMRRGQIQALQAVDEAVERILGAVDASGATADTAVLFTSDNGLSWDEHRWIGKGCAYEECLRVPLVVRLPSSPRAGRVEPRMALNIDLAPTIAALAGVPAPRADGRSLLPLIGGASGRWRSSFLFEFFTNPGDVQPSFAGIRTTRWKRVRYPDPSDDELLDLATDPYELQSKPPDPRQMARRLDHRLRDAQR